MPYLFVIGKVYTPKNKLQQEAISFIKTKDRLIVADPGDAIMLKGEITNKINELNAKYPRCTPIDVQFNTLKSNEDDQIGHLIVRSYVTAVTDVSLKVIKGNYTP